MELERNNNNSKMISTQQFGFMQYQSNKYKAIKGQ